MNIEHATDTAPRKTMPICRIRMCGYDGHLFSDTHMPAGKHILSYILRTYCVITDSAFTDNLMSIISKANDEITHRDFKGKDGRMTYASLTVGDCDDLDFSVSWDVEIIDIRTGKQNAKYDQITTEDLLHLMTMTDYSRESICIDLADTSSNDVKEHTKQGIITLPTNGVVIKCADKENHYYLIDGNPDGYVIT